MANPEHLRILKQGVEVWNEWREDNPDVMPDLTEADIHGEYLRKADLQKADLQKANLQEADLQEADLKGANLKGANLLLARLVLANLRGANLREANLREAILNGAILLGAILKGVNLHKAYISGTWLPETDLHGVNLKEAYLYKINLHGANLSKADLRGANLYGADMTATILVKANITGVSLYGVACHNWLIDGIKCDYIFFDPDAKKRTPKDRDFRPGEFEELYRSLPTIDYYFEKGFTPIDAVIMDKVVQAINEKHPEFELRLDSFHSRGQPHAKFTVLHKEYSDQALQKIAIAYGEKIKYLEGQRDQANAMLSQFMTKLIEQPKIMTGDIEGQICFNPTDAITQNLEAPMGDDIKIFSGGDTSFAKDHGTSIIYKFTNQPAETLYKEIEQAIQQADANETDKEDAQDNLNKIGKELEKPKPDKSRLTRLWDGIVAAIPQIAVKLPWDEMIKKVLP